MAQLFDEFSGAMKSRDLAPVFDEFSSSGTRGVKSPIKAQKKPAKVQAPKVPEQLYVSNREKDLVEEDAYAITEDVTTDNDYAEHIIMGGLLNTPRFKRRSWHR